MKFATVFKHTDSFDNENDELRKLAIRVAQILYPLYPSDPTEVDVHYTGEIDSRNQ
jgi:hypothetical protein